MGGPVRINKLLGGSGQDKSIPKFQGEAMAQAMAQAMPKHRVCTAVLNLVPLATAVARATCTTYYLKVLSALQSRGQSLFRENSDRGQTLF